VNSRLLFLFAYFVGLSVGWAQNSGTSATAGPLTIENAVSDAVQHNLSLLAERYNISVAKARVITARLRPNPILTLDADHVPWAGTTFNAQNQAGPPEYSIRTDFVFERGRKRESRIAVAEKASTVAELQFLDTLRSLILEVQNAFVETLLAKASLVLARDNATALANVVQINENRLRAGDVARVELTRVQLAQLQYENAVRQAELRLQTARMHLQLVIGRSAATPTIDVAGAFRRTPVTFSLNELRQQADQKRPDIAALRQDQARSQAEVRLQLAQGKVDYTVGSEFRRQQGFAGRGNSLGFFVQTNLPIFNRNQGEIERARQERLQVQAKLRATIAAMGNEVQTAYAQYGTSKDALDRIEQQMLGRARDVRETTEYSYKRGEASLVEFLDAQRAYNDTIQAYNDAQADFARSLYTIDSATGVSVNR
jgi:cobalt-zinc-cadmium efflux system outer membrane protein